MIRCSDEAIQQYAEGTLDPPERALVEAHLATCAPCRQALLAYKALMWDLAHLPPAAAPPGLEQVGDRLMAAWEAQQAAARAGRAPSWVPAWVPASLAWTRTTPGVAGALATARRAGQRLPGLLAALARAVRGGGSR